MKVHGTHRTHYSFDQPVTLDRHTIRLTPRSGGGQLLKKFHLHVEPEPCAVAELIDAEGNALQNCWFSGQTDHLTILTEFEVENKHSNPFDYIPAQSAVIPFRANEQEKAVLHPAQKGIVRGEMQELALQIADRCGGSAVDYVSQANQWVYENIRYEVREDGEPYSPDETLRDRRGACRDTAVLLMAFCRAMALPARFVSGYQEGDADTEQRDLHAWAEVWIPGGGWRGFDPTHGLAVADRHIPLAASVDPLLTAPVSGGFFSRHAVAQLPEHHIRLSVS